MSSPITGFRITGLHGHQQINITIQDNCVVLVGVNGLGKTTIINILYYFLTRQWSRLLEYNFKSIAVDVGDETISVSRNQLESPVRGDDLRRALTRRSPHMARIISSHPDLFRHIAVSPDDPATLRSIAERNGIPYALIRDARYFLDDDPLQQELFGSSSDIRKIDESLSKHLLGQVLYLPTYRRIERDLEKLFPGLDEHLQRQRSLRASRETSYLEFVEFGMTDVERRFSDVLTRLKEQARSELNSLAAGYLGEVIRGEADTYDTALIASIDTDTVTRILNRIEERDILDAPDQRTLREVIARLQTPEIQPSTQDKYVGHFFSKLAHIHKSLAADEAAVESFVTVCNRYLTGKSIRFDDRKYTITIHQTSPNKESIELRHLSSGEKQIVSLFTHVYMSDASNFIVLIDEPELSLSVPWQKQLLPDIRNSGRCGFLAAVTHSPFIYDNQLRSFATDLQQCIGDR